MVLKIVFFENPVYIYIYIFQVSIPLLVMGTKMDSAQEKRGLPTHQKRQRTSLQNQKFVENYFILQELKA